MDLLDRVVAIARAFVAAEVPHSFGGAIALGYYGLVRATHDIDVNVYLVVDRADLALDTLCALGVATPTPAQRGEIRRRGQTRLHWDGVPIDLFFWNLDFHASCLARRRPLALLEHTIDVLGPEELIVCKVAFARAKDASDVEAMLDVLGSALDVAYVLGWVESIVGLESVAARHLVGALEQRALLPAR